MVYIYNHPQQKLGNSSIYNSLYIQQVTRLWLPLLLWGFLHSFFCGVILGAPSLLLGCVWCLIHLCCFPTSPEFLCKEILQNQSLPHQKQKTGESKLDHVNRLKIRCCQDKRKVSSSWISDHFKHQQIVASKNLHIPKTELSIISWRLVVFHSSTASDLNADQNFTWAISKPCSKSWKFIFLFLLLLVSKIWKKINISPFGKLATNGIHPTNLHWSTDRYSAWRRIGRALTGGDIPGI